MTTIEATMSSTDLVCSFGDSDCAANFGRTTSVNDTVIDDKVARGADGIVQGTLGLVDNLKADFEM